MKEDPAFVRHMLDATEHILSYTEELDRQEFGDRPAIQDAVIRQFEILGEASKQVPDAVKEEHPELPWSDVAGMRDRLIHGYFTVDLDLVW